MKLGRNGAIEILGLLIFTVLQVVVLKGAEHLDRNVIHKEKYKTMETNFVGDTREWRPKFSEELKIEGGGKYGHDSNALPPGLTVDTNYVHGNKSE